jgi:hypothetical protein
MAEDDAADQGGAAAFHAAINNLRETAKWMAGIFGGIGGVLIASSSLTNVGQLKPDDPRLQCAAGSGLVAALAIGIILWLCLRVLVSKPTTLTFLVDGESKQRPDKVVKQTKELLGLADSRDIKQLRETYQNSAEGSDSEKQARLKYLSCSQQRATARYVADFGGQWG